MTETILLMGHGSADREGALEFVELAEAVRGAAPEQTIEAGFLEFGGPVLHTIAEAIDLCAERGDRKVLAVPVLLAYAGHAKYDMPGQIRDGQERHPHLDLQAAPPFGIQETLLEIVEQRIREAQEGLPPCEPQDIAVLLVGRGTTDPEANADIYKIGRLLTERNNYGFVECCFIAMTEPRLPAGIDRCVRLAAKQVIVAPYFINTGTLVKRIWTQAEASGPRHPGVQIALARHMGVHPELVQFILNRAQVLSESGAGAAMLSERMCLYRCGATRSHHHDHNNGHHRHDHNAATAVIDR